MSSTGKQSNLDIAKRADDAFRRGAVDEVMQIMHEDVEWIEAEGGPYGGTYHGHDEVMTNVFAPLGGEWETFAAEPDRFVEDDDTVAAMGTYSGTHAKTGKHFEAPFAHAMDLEDGRIVRFEQYVDTVRMNEAAAE